MVLLVTIAKEVENGNPVKLNIDYAIEERIQILGNSGSGKSHLARCICEQTYGKIQQIIISPKKEFVTLREKFDYIHVGTNSQISKPDIELNARYAGQLALKILESGMNAIIEFSEAPKDRIKFLKNFIEDGLMLAPEHLWHPVMIFIDEIDVWAPEKGHGEAESLGAIVDLAARGRDKGYFLMAATQKLAKFNKDVASELNIKFIGKVSLDNDQTRAAQELGIPVKEKTKLRFLGRPDFHFYAFGPGLSDDVIKIKSLPVQTTHVSGYKRNKLKKIIPTPETVKKVVAAFSDLPKEAEKELKTKDELKKKINELTLELRKTKNQSKDISPIDLKAAHEAGHKKAYDEFLRTNNKLRREHNDRILKIVNDIKVALKFNSMIKQNLAVSDKLAEILSHAHPAIEGTKITEMEKPKPLSTPKMEHVSEPYIPKKDSKIVIHDYANVEISDESLTGPESKILTSLLQCPDRTGTRPQVALGAGYSPRGSAFKNPVTSLKTKGYLTYDGKGLTATQEAIDKFPDVQPIIQDNETIQQFWLDKVTGPQRKILKPIIEAYPDAIPREEAAEKSGYSAAGSAFKNPVTGLKSIGLIEYVGKSLKATRELFPEMYA